MCVFMKRSSFRVSVPDERTPRLDRGASCFDDVHPLVPNDERTQRVQFPQVVIRTVPALHEKIVW